MVDIGQIDIRNLPLSPYKNPLIETQSIQTKKRWTKTGRADQMINAATGEVVGVSAIHSVEEKDDEHFVKVFAAGIAASFELTKTAQRVFQAVLEQYQKTPMTGGYADFVNLLWFDNGLDGRKLDISERTFRRGLKELLSKKFIAPKDGVSFWTNPSLFFKGDRVIFIKEYRRRRVIEGKKTEQQAGGALAP